MEIKITVVFLSFMIAAVSASFDMVNISSAWRPDFGWEITCSWRLFANDSLQSVRLLDQERQFLVYRPEKNGPKFSQLYHLPDKIFQAECYESSERGVMGKCVMTLELLQPASDDLRYACEVSGERPWFRMDKKDIKIAALVPPSDAEIEVAQRDTSGTRVVLNCTSSGLPAPNLQWSIGDQRVPQDFSGKSWNLTSKLWHSWSLLSYTSNNIPATCTPEISKGSQTLAGKSEEYSAAGGIQGTTNVICGLLSLLALTR